MNRILATCLTPADLFYVMQLLNPAQATKIKHTQTESKGAIQRDEILSIL